MDRLIFIIDRKGDGAEMAKAMQAGIEREVATDAHLDDVDDCDEEEERWRPAAPERGRRDRLGGIRRRGSNGL
jgi:hypothetical protein